MNRKIQLAAMTAAALTLAGCASTTPTVEVTQGYAVFDVKPKQPLTHAQVAEAVRGALQKNMSSVQVTSGLPPSPLPEKAGRFAMVSPFKPGSGLAALAAASGQAAQIPTCEGAILTANASDSSKARHGEGTTFFACLMPYQGGWGLNIVTTFSKASGAFSASTLAATLVRPLTGDSGQFIPRTIREIVEVVRAAGAEVTLVESYP